MPVVVKLIPRRGGSWMEIIPDEGGALKLPKDQVPLVVGPGSQLGESEWRELAEASAYFLLYDKALNLLSRREHFAAELRRKLFQRNRDDGLVERVVAECRRQNYLDDTRALEACVRSLSLRGGMGARRMEHELLKRGCPRELVAEGVAAFRQNVDEDAEVVTYLESKRASYVSKAASLASKLERGGMEGRELEFQLRQRLSRTLLSNLAARGFTGEAARQAGRDLLNSILDTPTET